MIYIVILKTLLIALMLFNQEPVTVETENVTEVAEETNMTYVGNFSCTAYTWTGNPCANGNYPVDGYSVACNSLDFGTHIYIEGIGERVVEDRGPSSMPSAWLDIYMDSYDACVQWGVQDRAVYIIE